MAETVGALIITSIATAADVGIYGTSILTSLTFAGVSLSTAVGTAAIIGTSIGLQYALTRQSLPKPEDGSQALKQAIPPRIRGYGRNRLAGYYMLYEENSKQSLDVMAIHSGRVGSYVQLYLHDDMIDVPLSILSTAGSGAVTSTYGDGRYGDGYINVETRFGTTTQTASSLVLASGLAPVWDATHCGQGIAWIALLCGAAADVPGFTKHFPHQLPVLSALTDCSVIWNPRDPAQDRNDETTWLVSFNPVIQLIDYLTRVDGGMGLDYDTIIAPNLTSWIAEADLCDATVATSVGTELRYQSSGWFQFDNKPEDVIGGLLSTCDGWLAESGDGSLSIRVGVYSAPTDPPLTEKHITGFALNYGQADEQLVNQLDISFTDPASKYVSVQTAPWRDEDSIALTGAVRSRPLDLKWVQSNSQARRLADRAMQRLNPLMTGSFTTTLYGLRYLGKRWVPLQYPFVSGLQNCVVEIQGAEVDLMAGRINWNFIRIEPDTIEAYDPTADQGSTPVVPPPAEDHVLMREDDTPYLREDASQYIREGA